MDDMYKLNEVSKSDTFKKSLVANLGTDTVKGVAQLAVQGISHGLSLLGNTGQLLGNLVQVYGQEAARQVTDLANVSAQYILYRFARKAVYGEEQTINEGEYSL